MNFAARNYLSSEVGNSLQCQDARLTVTMMQIFLALFLYLYHFVHCFGALLGFSFLATGGLFGSVPPPPPPQHFEVDHC